MIEGVALTILFGSLLGIATILFRKIPMLVELQLQEEGTVSRQQLFFRLKKKIKNISFLKSAFFEIFLQKILSKIRILTLRMENKTASWLQKLREKSLKKKIKENDNYWEKIKKIKKRK